MIEFPRVKRVNTQARGTYWIKTLGCQMNVYDSQRIAEILQSFQYDEVKTPEDADIIVLNTCHIREKATEKVYSDLGRLRCLNERPMARHKRITVVAGCVAQAEGDLIQKRAPNVDIVIGPQDLHILGKLIRQTTAKQNGAKKQAYCVVELQADSKFEHLPEERLASGVCAYVTVQEGCDKFCSFCVVPYTRGSDYARARQAILTEIMQLAQKGAKEICLLGQNVNAWQGQDENGRSLRFADLLHWLIENAPQIERWRYVTSHPLDMHDDLIALHGTCPALMPFLHLPIQSGSDRVLRAMNRRYRTQDYLQIMEKLYLARPDLALSSDFIVGFPGETEEDFLATCRIAEACRFVHSFSFLYSPRPGTPAANRPQPNTRPVLLERLYHLQDLLKKQTHDFNESFVGHDVDVLFEEPGRHPHQWRGKTPWLQSIHVECPDRDLAGQIKRVRVKKASATSLAGTFQPSPMRQCV